MSNGFLVVCEGIDKSGKTSIITELEKEHRDWYYTREPSALWTGEYSRQCVSADKTHPLTDLYALQADRAQNFHNGPKQYLERGGVVVYDRYIDSTRAYQREQLEGVVESPEEYIESVLTPFREPDLTLFIDVPVDVALQRDDGDEKFEKEAFLTEVRKNYQQMERDRSEVKRVDGERSVEAIAEGCERIIEIFND